MPTMNKTAVAATKFIRRFYEWGYSPKRAERTKIDNAARLLAKSLGFDYKKYVDGDVSVGARKKITTRGKKTTTTRRPVYSM